MAKIYIPLLCLLLFSSCSFHLVTKGIKDKTSNYVVTADGKQINASSVSFNSTTVSVDTAKLPLENVSAIKQGPAYFGVQDGIIYNGVYFGRLMLLNRFVGTSYDINTHSTRAIYSYYLQKQGESEIVDFTFRNLIDNVRDNPLALRKARAGRIYSYLTYTSAVTFIGGLSCVFLSYSNPLRKPLVTAGLFSLPVFFVSLPLGPHKKYKSVVVYNR